MKSSQKNNWLIRFLMLAIFFTVPPIWNNWIAGRPAEAAVLMTGAAGAAVKTTANDQADKPGAEALKAQDKDGFPVPDNYTNYAGEKSAYLQSVTATSPSTLKTVLAFYSRELKTRHWRELPGSSGVTDAKAHLLFENNKKEHLALELIRNSDGGTDIRLTVRSKAEAMKDGILPPPGKARIYLGNMTDGQAEFAFGPKKFMLKKESTNDGSMKNAPFIEVTPGSHPYTLTVAGQKPFKDKIEVGPDETWGLIAGPGGGLPIQMY